MGSLEVIKYSNNGGTSTTELFFFKTTGWKSRVRYLKGWKDIAKGEYSTQVHLQNYLILLDNHCMILWTEWNTQATYYSQKQLSQSLGVILDRTSPWMDHTLANSKTNPTNWTTIKFHTTRLLCKTKEGVIDRLIDCFLHLTHCGREDLSKWTIFNTILTSPKSWLSQENLDAGCELSLVPMDS